MPARLNQALRWKSAQSPRLQHGSIAPAEGARRNAMYLRAWRIKFAKLRHSRKQLGCRLWVQGCKGHREAELAKVSDVAFAAAFQSLGVEDASFDISDLVVEHLPDDT